MTTQQTEGPQPELTLDQEIEQMTTVATAATEAAMAQEGPEAVEVQPAAVAEPEAVMPVVQPPTAAEETARLRQENARLVQEAAQRRGEAETQQLANQVQQYANQFARKLVDEQGWNEQQALAYAEAQKSAYLANYQLGMERKTNLARQLSLEHQVAAESLMVYNTPEEMSRAAQHMGPQARELATLRKEIADMKKSQVPAQAYNQPPGRRGITTEDQLLDQYNRGVRTPETEAAARRAAGF